MPKLKFTDDESVENNEEELDNEAGSSDDISNEEGSKPAKTNKKKEATPIETKEVKPKSNLQLIKENEEHTRRVLNAQKKVDFFVPLEPGEEMGAYDLVSINGVEFKVFKGSSNIIPEAVAKILKDKYRISNNPGYKRAENIKELEE